MQLYIVYFVCFYVFYLYFVLSYLFNLWWLNRLRRHPQQNMQSIGKFHAIIQQNNFNETKYRLCFVY